MSFQSKLVSESDKKAPIYLVTAQVKGKAVWYYLKLDALKHNAFKKQLEAGDLKVDDFGEVLESGWGTYPPDPIVALMHERFNAAA